VEGSNEDSNESLGSLKCLEHAEAPRQPLRKGSTPWPSLIETELQ
jgi:hypothetical protein